MSKFDENMKAWEEKVEKTIAKNAERKEKFVSGGNEEVKRLSIQEIKINSEIGYDISKIINKFYKFDCFDSDIDSICLVINGVVG